MTIYKSPLKAPSPVHQDVYHYLFQTRKHIAPDSKDALIDAFTGQKYTYGQLRSDTLLFADGFANKHKLKQGDVILIFSPNSIHYPIPLFGGQAAGLTVSTANSGYTPPELAHQIRNSESKIVIVSSDLLPVALKALKEKDVSVKEDKVFVLPGADGNIKVEGGAKSWEELRGKKGFKPIKVTDKTKLAKFPAYRPYSSGTTGLSKGVDISHSNMVVMMEGLRPTGLSNKDDKILAVLPLYHIYGLVVLLHSIFAEGATCVVMPKFDMVKFLESVAKYKVTTPSDAGCMAQLLDTLILQSGLANSRDGKACIDQDLRRKLSDTLNALIESPEYDEWAPTLAQQHLVERLVDKLDDIEDVPNFVNYNHTEDCGLLHPKMSKGRLGRRSQD